MTQETLAELRARAIALWRRARESYDKLPPKLRIGAVAALAFVALLTLHAVWASAHRDSVLHVKVQHGFRSAQLEVSVDGDSVYSGRLYGTTRKKFGLWSDGVQGSMSQSIPVSSGKHVVVVHVAADDGTIHEDSITGEFVAHNTRDLMVVARRSDLDLAWQGGGAVTSAEVAPVPAQAAPTPTWQSRYATTILLSILGSLISALTGYAIRELPGRIRNRQAAVAEDKPRARSAAAGG
jgi:hypothetical protein